MPERSLAARNSPPRANPSGLQIAMRVRQRIEFFAWTLLDVRPAARVRLSAPLTSPHRPVAWDGQTNFVGPFFMSFCAVREHPPISSGALSFLEYARGLAGARAVFTDNRRQDAFPRISGQAGTGFRRPNAHD